MNKKSLKIAGWALGLSMAVAGIGATVGSMRGLNESPLMAAADEENSIVFGDLGLTNGVQYSDPFDGGNFTITFAGGSNDGKYYTTGKGIRIYGGGYFTVASKSTDDIVSASFVWDSEDYSPSDNVASVGTYDKTTYTWTGSALSFTMTRPSGSGHWRLKSVTVTTKAASTGPELSINNFEGEYLDNYILPGQEGTFGFTFSGSVPEYDEGEIVWSVEGDNASKINVNPSTGEFLADSDVNSLLSITLILEILDNDTNVYEATKTLYICPHALTNDALSVSSPKKVFTLDDPLSVIDSGTSIKATFMDAGIIDVLKQESLYGGTLSYAIDGKAVPSNYQLLMKDNNKSLVVSYTYAGKTVSASGFTITVNEKEIAKPSLVEGWNLVTSSSEALAAGQQVVIAASGDNYAISTTQNSNNRVATAISKGASSLSEDPDANVEIFTLVQGTKTGTFGLKTHDGQYIYAASSGSNYLRTQEDLDDNASFAITLSSNGIASITAQGSNTRNQLKYNSNKLFACYSSGQGDVALYRHSSPSTADYLQNWVYDYMHLQEIGLSDNTAGEDCKGASGYYLTAKAALATLEASHSGCIELLENNAAFADARQRYETWAAANGDASPYDGKADIQASAVVRFGTSAKTNTVLTVSIVAGVGALVAGSLLLFRRKKEN